MTIIDKIKRWIFGKPIIETETQHINETEHISETKTVRIKLKFHDQGGTNVEEIDILVPNGLSEEEENKYIDDIVDRDYNY